MLYTLLGTDIDKIRTKARELSKALLVRRPDASFFRLHTENWSADKFVELSGSQGLFSSKYIVLLDNLLTGETKVGDGESNSDSESAKEIIFDHLASLKKSEHIWILVEDSLFGSSSGKELGVKNQKDLEKIKKELEKYSDKMEVHDKRSVRSATSNKGGYGSGAVSTFNFIDAVMEKDKIKSLAVFAELEKQGLSPEEIHGGLWWQVKVLFQVRAGDTKKLSPFVVTKAKKFLKQWPDSDLNKLSNDVVDMYHLAHLGQKDFSGALMKLGF